MALSCVVENWGVCEGAPRNVDEATKKMLAKLPRLLRRRLTPLARTVFTAIDQCALETYDMPLVFSSTHGELAKSFNMMRQIEAGEEISPTHFSLSVHNAIAGLFSMAFNNQQQCSVIAPGMEGIAPGFIEALGLLQEGYAQVLLVFYDEPLVPFYPAEPFRLSADEMALALCLSADGKGLKLHVSPRAESGDDGEQPLHLPRLVNFLNNPEQGLLLRTAYKGWCWQLDA